MSAFGPSYPGEAAGGGGTPTDLLDLSLGSPLDLTDGSWTLVDPDTLVKSVSFATGVNTVTFNALGSGNGHYVLSGTSTNFRAPRWYRAWNVNSVRVNSSALVIWDCILDVDTSVFDYNNNIGIAVAADPTSTTRASIKAMGSLFARNASGNWRYGAWSGVGSALASASNQFARVSGSGQYGAGHMGSATFIALNSLDDRVQNGSRNGSSTVADTDLFEMVSVGTFNGSATISDSDTVKFKAYFAGVRFTLP
jgi:hypothetical protein